ncbi:triacylglycerol lipase [Dysgonomonas sp. PFB1-18]|uniref:DUF6620 family protein n=1 Tax=unclassified Dysgonomonas TaxID=2630389 RepID=UPI002474264D|nr:MULTISPECIES: DUF6620 family protein [unclassified Dysgonomonas]MDH6308656.1 triacylglycerol lipase [Dysgonomonas sp. PF1-14]MDH6338157.1 triacylglycerol lipase [Dysgonomonas sp. PF1-16]MDH6379654.1 triacylglycerol lipase [Dysgonomonas sp. PFB1-18]MDH6396984.1 triacylglycerol lipase [Dysgonomonas sp. PF1-23]
METINGVNFEDYAAACANLAQGMSEERVMEILELEKPVWDDTMNRWNERLGQLMTEDMDVATKYGEIFANPKVGRFKDVVSNTVGIQELLPIVPDYETYQKIFWQQSTAAQYGVDPVSVLESYGIDIGKWGVLNMHYMGQGINSIADDDPHYNDKYNYFLSVMNYWENYWEEHYKENKVDLSSDINF